jgi:hypothetical protein
LSPTGSREASALGLVACCRTAIASDRTLAGGVEQHLRVRLRAAVVLGPCLVIQLRRAWAAGVRRRQARLRAEALLWAWLSPAQRKQYRARRWFEVTTASGRRYRILRGGVVRLDPRGSGYCIEATSPVPVADEMLANKLLLETDERRFLATAHRFPYR